MEDAQVTAWLRERFPRTGRGDTNASEFLAGRP